MIFAAGFLIAAIAWLRYRLTGGSISGLFFWLGITLMLISILLFIGKYLP